MRAPPPLPDPHDPDGPDTPGGGATGPLAVLWGWLAGLLLAEREAWVLWLPVALGLGIAGYFAAPQEPPSWPAPVALAALAFVLARIQGQTRGPMMDGALFAGWGLAAGLAGLTLAQAWSDARDAPVLSHPLGPLAIEGRVRLTEPQDRGWRLVLDQVVMEDYPAALTPARVRLRVSARSVGDDPPAPGVRVAVLGRLMPPPEPVAPGAFDHARTLWFDRIGAVGYALGPLRQMGAISPPGVPHPGASLPLLDHPGPMVEGLRDAITRRLQAAAPGPVGALAAALLTGERRAVPDAAQEALRSAGLAHLLAISGLHMSMVGGLLFVTARGLLALWPAAALCLPIKNIAAVCALAGCLGYLVISGAGIPAQRAVVMTGLVFGAILLHRTALSMRTVAAAAVLVLLLRPDSLLGPSFQMSFAAVVALIAVYEALWPRLGAWRTRARGAAARGAAVYLVGILVTTLVASTATLPFAAHHFHRVALFAVPANLLAVPVMGLWVMPWGIAALVLMPLGLEEIAVAAMGWGIVAILAVADWVSSWPGAVLPAPAAPAWGLGLVALGGLWVCLWRRPWRWLGGGPLLVGLMLPWLTPQPDLLVSGGGRLVASRAEDGALVFSDLRRERFARSRWQDAFGRAADPVAVQRFPASGSTPDGRLSCDGQGCLYHAPGGLIVALPRSPDALAEDRWIADLILTDSAGPPRMTPPDQGPPRPAGQDPAVWDCPLHLDAASLTQTGALALWSRADGHIRVATVAAHRGLRPWSRAASLPPPQPPGRVRRQSLGPLPAIALAPPALAAWITACRDRRIIQGSPRPPGPSSLGPVPR